MGVVEKEKGEQRGLLQGILMGMNQNYTQNTKEIFLKHCKSMTWILEYVWIMLKIYIPYGLQIYFLWKIKLVFIYGFLIVRCGLWLSHNHAITTPLYVWNKNRKDYLLVSMIFLSFFHKCKIIKRINKRYCILWINIFCD